MKESKKTARSTMPTGVNVNMMQYIPGTVSTIPDNDLKDEGLLCPCMFPWLCLSSLS